ncbi:hypothetical protein ES703_114826 [subsurface metagenome]
MSLIRLRLKPYKQPPALLAFIFTQPRDAFLEILIHPPDADTGKVVAKRAVPDYKRRRLRRIRMPRLLQSTVCQVNSFCA